jgi:hypothetical protein
MAKSEEYDFARLAGRSQAERLSRWPFKCDTKQRNGGESRGIGVMLLSFRLTRGREVRPEHWLHPGPWH